MPLVSTTPMPVHTITMEVLFPVLCLDSKPEINFPSSAISKRYLFFFNSNSTSKANLHIFQKSAAGGAAVASAAAAEESAGSSSSGVSSDQAIISGNDAQLDAGSVANTNLLKENSPIPLNEYGLPPNLIPLSTPQDFNRQATNPINLQPYPYNSYPLIYDSFGGGYNVNPYLPPFSYYPSVFGGPGAAGAAGPGPVGPAGPGSLAGPGVGAVDGNDGNAGVADGDDGATGASDGDIDGNQGKANSTGLLFLENIFNFPTIIRRRYRRGSWWCRKFFRWISQFIWRQRWRNYCE